MPMRVVPRVSVEELWRTLPKSLGVWEATTTTEAKGPDLQIFLSLMIRDDPGRGMMRAVGNRLELVLWRWKGKIGDSQSE